MLSLKLPQVPSVYTRVLLYDTSLYHNYIYIQDDLFLAMFLWALLLSRAFCCCCCCVCRCSAIDETRNGNSSSGRNSSGIYTRHTIKMKSVCGKKDIM